MALFDTVVAVRKARAKFGTEKFERLFRTTAELLDAELLDGFFDNPANNPFHRVLPGALRGKPGVDIKRWQKKRREHQESTFYTVGSRISDGGGTKRAPQEHCHHPNYEMELGETDISLYPDEGCWTCNRCQARWSAEPVQKYQWTGDEPDGNERCMFGLYAGYRLATALKKDPLYCREVMRAVRSGEWPRSGFFAEAGTRLARYTYQRLHSEASIRDRMEEILCASSSAPPLDEFDDYLWYPSDYDWSAVRELTPTTTGRHCETGRQCETPNQL